MKKETKKIWLSLLALAGAAALLTLLNSKITLYSDDYWYGTFFREGLSGFWAEMKQHYLETNGRFFIHLLVPFVLLFDTKLFMILSPLLLALLFWGGSRFLNRSLSLPASLAAAALGMLAVMACDSRYLRMTLLWISAYFNYIFPLFLLLWAAFLQQKGQKRGLFLALLAGASTEQCGIMALILLGGLALFDPKNKKGWLYPIAALLGFLTVLLAPGSWARVDRGVEGGILSCLQPRVFAERFLDAMRYVVKYPSTAVLLAVLFALAALLALADRRLNRWLLLGFPLAAGQLLFFALGWNTAGCLWAAAGLLCPAILFLLQKEYRPTGLTLLAALASFMMLIITGMSSERTVFCGITALILVTVSLMLCLPGRTKIILPAAAAAVCLCCWIPTFRGYSIAKETVDRNLQAVQESAETGVCYFDLDIDPRYRYTMPCDGPSFLANYREYYRIPAETALIFTSEKWKISPLAGSLFPALEDETGLYFPLEAAIQAAGGTAEFSWNDHSYTIQLDGKSYRATRDGILYSTETGQQIAAGFQFFPPHLDIDTLLYISADRLQQYFGIEWQFENGYIIQ
ncbi:MAG: hypothetical protein IJ043_00255 [Clostridia bacterium]|nr:hypothetical protein [Clostridia bacterium]